MKDQIVVPLMQELIEDFRKHLKALERICESLDVGTLYIEDRTEDKFLED